MSRVFDDLLAMDAAARKSGCGGLNSRLRAALVADARWPSKRAGPVQAISDTAPVPDNVVFWSKSADTRKQSA